jgi:ABC-type sulfate transport system permease component
MGSEASPEVCPEQMAAADLIKLIRKLRWIGMEEEADQLQLKLEACGIALATMIVGYPYDTD